ncbi:alpha/beta fold hydrolase [Thiosulfativibrio zosterae]|uniref:Sigma factor SigB regulation protein RsbQ n=1 Tax=Thiosulfativibrio zosterae TaxID=2675053 RepID=A0A6F8PQM7_9GAMM|nr:alpha/beta hydrolase [Thiosulfativibrio zosterae]BBP44386.1 sigma factor SigB regulation protein RsbQ [Thiosulfativibrio zosterae]
MFDNFDKNTIQHRNNVQIVGEGSKTLMLAHGFGCDQNMWRFLTPYLEDNYQVILFDYVGCGKSDFNAFNKSRYSSLEGYAQDILDICQAFELKDIIFVGHSVSSIIGMLASLKKPTYFAKLAMVCPSPCFLNLPPDYLGGFEKDDLVELINLMDKNYIGWANFLAPLVMGQKNDAELIEELESSFCSTDPNFAKPFAKATFFSDYRKELNEVTHPSLIIQSTDDSLASVDIGHYMQNEMPAAELAIIEAHGHCLHMTKPQEVMECLKDFI